MSGSKQQVFYIHGGDSFSSQESFLEFLKTIEIRDPFGEGGGRWTQTLRSDLGDNFEVFQPTMPCKENARYDEWKVWFERHIPYLHDGVILIGWSLGGMFLLKYLSEEKLPLSIRACLIVSSPAGDYEIVSEPGNTCDSFHFSLNSLAEKLGYIDNLVLYHSEDDFVVPYEHALKLKESLPEAELVTFTDRNHFLQPEFPELIAKIRELAGE